MARSHSRSMGLVVAAIASLVGGGAMAQTPAPAGHGNSLRTPATPSEGTWTVRERLAQPVSNGCRYLGTVQGKLEPQRGSSDDSRGPSRYAPMLVVSAEVECGHGVLHHVEPTRIDGPSFSQTELEGAIRAAARVNVDTAGQICSYEPDVRVEGTSVSLPTVRESCRRDVPQNPPRR